MLGLPPESLSLIILAGAGMLIVIIIAVGIFTARRETDIGQQRLEIIERSDVEAFVPLDEESAITRGNDKSEAVKRVDKILSDRNIGRKWRTKLARADLKLTVAEFFALHFISMTGFFAFAYFVMFQGDIIFSIVAAFIGFFAPRIFVGRRISKRLIQFETQLPDTLSLWVNALRSGYSVLQAMEAIARDAPEPTRTEFFRVVQEVQLGIDMDDAFAHLLERVESPDLDLVITAVNIQREVGGNLSEILEVISMTIRERIKLKGEIRVLTSQGRITGYLISFLPIILALFLNTINPGYMGQMFEDRLCGWPMIGISLTMIGIGSAVIQKIVDIEI